MSLAHDFSVDERHYFIDYRKFSSRCGKCELKSEFTPPFVGEKKLFLNLCDKRHNPIFAIICAHII